MLCKEVLYRKYYKLILWIRKKYLKSSSTSNDLKCWDEPAVASPRIATKEHLGGVFVSFKSVVKGIGR
jgi:hypothetical protein